jgi:hypothetical protein
VLLDVAAARRKTPLRRVPSAAWIVAALAVGCSTAPLDDAPSTPRVAAVECGLPDGGAATAASMVQTIGAVQCSTSVECCDQCPSPAQTDRLHSVECRHGDCLCEFESGEGCSFGDSTVVVECSTP